MKVYCDDCEYWEKIDEQKYVCTLVYYGYFRIYPSINGYPNLDNDCEAYEKSGQVR